MPWWQREADTATWGAKINHLIPPSYQDFSWWSKTHQRGNAIIFFCIIFNFPFWVMQWSLLPRAVFFPWSALGILDTHETHCVLPFFLPSSGISAVVQAALREKGKPKSNTFQCWSCVMMEKGILGKQGSESEGSGYSGALIKPSSGFICGISTESQAEILIKGR